MKPIFLLFAAFLCLSADAQNPYNLKWGPEFQAPRNSSVVDIIGFDNSGFYALKGQFGLFSGGKLSMEKYDPNLKPIRNIELDLVEEGRKAQLEHVLHLNDRLLMFTSYANSKTKTNGLFVQPINKQTLLPDAKQKTKVGEINFEGNSRRNSGDFGFRLAQDSSHLLVFYSLPYKRGEAEKFGFIVLDKNMNLKWKKDITLPYNDEKFGVEGFRVDSEGNAYLLGILYKTNRTTKRKADGYAYKIVSFSNKGETSKEYSVALRGKFITDVQFGVRSNKDIVCAGFYSEVGTRSIRGTFFISIDTESKEIKTESLKEFDINFITQNFTEGEAKRAKRKEERGKELELFEYDLDKLIVRSDGGALLVGEQYYVVTTTYSTGVGAGRSTRTITRYYYNDIICVNISPNGTIDWAVKVPKRQMSVDDGGAFLSYAMAIHRDKLYFIYNDNPDNLAYTGVGRVKNTNLRDQTVIVAQINSKGEMKRTPLGAGAGDVFIKPKVCEQISYGEMLLFGQRKKSQQFGRLAFD